MTCLKNVEDNILKYTCNELGEINVKGDLNSRTADLPDYFDFDKYLDDHYPFLNRKHVPIRVNRDHVIVKHGRCLLDLCMTSATSIANGRMSRDRDTGDYTYCSYQGQSTVNYIFLNFKILIHYCILKFLDFNFFRTMRLPRMLSNRIFMDSTNVNLFIENSTSKNGTFLYITNVVSSELVDNVVETFTLDLLKSASDVISRTNNKKDPQKYGRLPK